MQHKKRAYRIKQNPNKIQVTNQLEGHQTFVTFPFQARAILSDFRGEDALPSDNFCYAKNKMNGRQRA